ncbi:MAG: AI-2E family transporter [Chloroflexi bacterium]|nr:AI-2E family transporter [Chloroflexota bacterium]
MMNHWSKRQRARALITIALLLLLGWLLYQARRALLPFLLGSVFAYILLPFINWLDDHVRRSLSQRVVRGVSVLIAYVLTLLIIYAILTSVIPPIGVQVGSLIQRLPYFARNVYHAAPALVQDWLDAYNRVVPENIRLALQHSFENTIQSLLRTLQTGIFKGINVVFTTVSFVLGLIVVPLWMFYILRDEPEIRTQFYGLVPNSYREDVRNILRLIDGVLGAYLRGQLILCLSVAILTTIGLLILGIDFALLLGTIAGIFEVIPVLGPLLGAIPALLVTLATSPSRLLWVALWAVIVQQIENYLLVPQVARGTFRIHPALAILALVIGSEVAGIWGVILCLPITAIIRDVTRYLYLRLSDDPLSPEEALASVRIQARPSLSVTSRAKDLWKK